MFTPDIHRKKWAKRQEGLPKAAFKHGLPVDKVGVHWKSMGNRANILLNYFTWAHRDMGVI